MKESALCGELFKQIHYSMEKQDNNTLRRQDLTYSQVAALLALQDSEGHSLSMKEMEKKLHLAQSTTTGILSRLEAKGMVCSSVPDSNRRIKRVRLTGNACRNARRPEPIWKNATSICFKAFPKKSRSG